MGTHVHRHIAHQLLTLKGTQGAFEHVAARIVAFRESDGTEMALEWVEIGRELRQIVINARPVDDGAA